jgi:hypothetical protein
MTWRAVKAGFRGTCRHQQAVRVILMHRCHDIKAIAEIMTYYGYRAKHRPASNQNYTHQHGTKLKHSISSLSPVSALAFRLCHNLFLSIKCSQAFFATAHPAHRARPRTVANSIPFPSDTATLSPFFTPSFRKPRARALLRALSSAYVRRCFWCRETTLADD